MGINMSKLEEIVKSTMYEKTSPHLKLALGILGSAHDYLNDCLKEDNTLKQEEKNTVELFITTNLNKLMEEISEKGRGGSL